MRARAFKILAPAIVALQVGVIAAWFLLPGVQRLLGESSLIAGAFVIVLGIIAWTLIPSAKKTRWPSAKKKPKPNPKPKPAPLAQAVPASPALVVAGAVGPGGSQEPKTGALQRSKQAITNIANGAKGLLTAAVALFGEKSVTSVFLAIGAQLGVPSGSVMAVLHAAGVDQKLASEPKRLDALEKGMVEIRLKVEGQQQQVGAMTASLSSLERAEGVLGTRVWRIEDALIKSPGGKIHMEVVDRRQPPEKNGQEQPDISLLIGKAISASSSYWKGHYCEAAKKVTGLATVVKPLSASMANFKGYWLWRLGDLVGAEKCFWHSYRAATPRGGAPDKSALRLSVMGWAQTYCMRRNYSEVYESNQFEKLKDYFAKRGITVKHANDEYLAETVLYLGMQHDPKLRGELEREMKGQTEFGRICSLAIQKVLEPGYQPKPGLEKHLDTRLVNLLASASSCAVHEPLDCGQQSAQ